MSKPLRHYSWYCLRAQHYCAIEQYDIYLESDDTLASQPWEFVSEIKDGCCWSGGVLTGVEFVAHHPCGLKFKWSVEIVGRDDGSLQCLRIGLLLSQLSPPCRAELIQWFRDRARKARVEILKTQQWVAQQLAAIEYLEIIT